MSKKRVAGTVPEPPWTYAPSEVAEWMASTAGPKRPREPRAQRQIRVKGFVGECPASAEGKLLRRLSELGFVPAEKRHGTEGLLGHGPPPTTFDGRLGDTRVHITLRKGAALELRIRFVPRVSSRRASKLVARLGLRHIEGTWT